MVVWSTLSSTNRVSECGNFDADHELVDMLDATLYWVHTTNHVHDFVLDLGSSKNVIKWRFKNQGGGVNRPDDVDIFISDTIGVWGTAVATGVDISAMSSDINTWTEVDSTDKMGRYVKFVINSTEHANNVLTWGSSSTTVIEFLEDIPPERITTHINISDTKRTTLSTVPNPTNGSLGQFEWDGSKYTDIISVYFEAVGSSTGGANFEISLYDATAPTTIVEVVGSSVTPLISRSANIVGSMPSGVAILQVRVSVSAGPQSATCFSGRLIITQEVQAGVKTRIYIPVGADEAGGSTSYKSTSNLNAFAINSPEEKHYIWESGDFDEIDNVHFQVNLSAIGNTSTCKLDTGSAGTGLAELTTSSSLPTILKSGDISGTISDSAEYTAWCKLSTPSRASVHIYGAWIVVDLINLTKYQTVLSINSHSQQETTTGWIEDTAHQAQFDSDSDFFVGVTLVLTHAATIWQDNDTNVQAAIYDDGTRKSTSDIIETGSTPALKESSALTIADSSILTGSANLNSSGTSKAGNVGGSSLYITVTGVDIVESERNRIHII